MNEKLAKPLKTATLSKYSAKNPRKPARKVNAAKGNGHSTILQQSLGAQSPQPAPVKVRA